MNLATAVTIANDLIGYRTITTSRSFPYSNGMRIHLWKIGGDEGESIILLSRGREFIKVEKTASPFSTLVEVMKSRENATLH